MKHKSLCAVECSGQNGVGEDEDEEEELVSDFMEEEEAVAELEEQLRDLE